MWKRSCACSNTNLHTMLISKPSSVDSDCLPIPIFPYDQWTPTKTLAPFSPMIRGHWLTPYPIFPYDQWTLTDSLAPFPPMISRLWPTPLSHFPYTFYNHVPRIRSYLQDNKSKMSNIIWNFPTLNISKVPPLLNPRIPRLCYNSSSWDTNKFMIYS